MKGLRAIAEENKALRRLVVSLDPRPRKIEGIDIFPYRDFLARLWSDEL